MMPEKRSMMCWLLILAMVSLLASACRAETPLPIDKPAPTATIQVVPLQKQVWVNVESLPLRCGPGETQPVVATVDRGAVLSVIGQTPDQAWLLVDLSDQEDAWVLAAFTAASPSATPETVAEPAGEEIATLIPVEVPSATPTLSFIPIPTFPILHPSKVPSATPTKTGTLLPIELPSATPTYFLIPTATAP